MNPSYPPTPPTHQELEAEIGGIVAEITRLVGLPSRWSGNIIIGTEIDSRGRRAYNGEKQWNCDIQIHQQRLQETEWRSTVVHESLHSVSVALNVTDYRRFHGFEEGVVEKCTRLLSGEVFAARNQPAASEIRTQYDDYLPLLEDLRSRTGKAEREFYLELLKTPLADRETTVVEWIQDAHSNKSRSEIIQEIALIMEELKP